MPQKHQPDHPYLRHVRITRVHIFTAIQIISLVGMFAVKSVKSIAIAFPLLVRIAKWFFSSHWRLPARLGAGDMLRTQDHGSHLHAGRVVLARWYFTRHENRSNSSVVCCSTCSCPEISHQWSRWHNRRKSLIVYFFFRSSKPRPMWNLLRPCSCLFSLSLAARHW